jgi:hypothetical protein
VLVLIVLGASRHSATAQTFDPVVNLSADPGGAEDHQVAANGNNVYVVWSDSTPGDYDIFFRRSMDGGTTWDSAVNLSTNPSTSRYPKLTVSGASVFVVWGDYTDSFTEQTILFRRSTDGGATFEPVQQLSTSPGIFPTLAASAANVYVVWGDAIGGGDDIFLRRSTDGGSSFHPVQVLSATGAAPQAAAAGGSVHVVWDNGNSVGFRRSVDGGATFGSIQQLSPAGAFPEVKATESTVLVVWQSALAPSNSDIYFARSADGGATFAPPQNLSDNSGQSALPRLAASGASVFVTWMDDTPANLEILFRRSADGGATFGPTLNLSASAGASWYPRVEAAGERVWAVWQDDTPTGPNLFDIFSRASSDGGATFEPTANLSVDGGSALPELAVSPGNAYVIWKNFWTGSGDIFFRAARAQAGDTDCDTDVDAVDCLYILQNVVGLRDCSNECPPTVGTLYCPAADTQCDEDIDAVDALFCLQHVVGTRPSLGCDPTPSPTPFPTGGPCPTGMVGTATPCPTLTSIAERKGATRPPSLLATSVTDPLPLATATPTPGPGLSFNPTLSCDVSDHSLEAKPTS